MKILLFILSVLFFFNLNIDIELNIYSNFIKIIAPLIVVSVACMSRVAWLIEDFWGNYLKLIIFNDSLLWR